jgi:succinyl-CoA synthetase beta subunit
MKLLEFEAKDVFGKEGIRIPKGVVVRKGEELPSSLEEIGDRVVVKAQVDIGGRGKTGGVLMADAGNAGEAVQHLFNTEIKGVPVNSVLIEERLPIEHEYYVSIAIDRSKKEPVILFADTGGVNIEETARTNPDAIRTVAVSPLFADVPAFLLRELTGTAPAEVRDAVNRL